MVWTIIVTVGHRHRQAVRVMEHQRCTERADARRVGELGEYAGAVKRRMSLQGSEYRIGRNVMKAHIVLVR